MCFVMKREISGEMMWNGKLLSLYSVLSLAPRPDRPIEVKIVRAFHDWEKMWVEGM